MTKIINNRATIAGPTAAITDLAASIVEQAKFAEAVRPLGEDETQVDAWGMRGEPFVFESSVEVSELDEDNTRLTFDFLSRGGAPIALFDYMFDEGYFVALYSFDEVEFVAYEFTNGQLEEYEVPTDSRIVSREVPHRVNRVLGLTERVASLMEMAE